MSRYEFNSPVVALVGGLLLCSTVCAAQTAADRVTAESNRLRQLLTTLQISEERTKAYQDRLNVIEAALRAGQVFVGLHFMQEPSIELGAYEYQKSKRNIEKDGSTAFEAEWRRVGTELRRKQEQLKAKRSARLPLVVQALIESAVSQANPYYQSGRLYGHNTTLEAGLYYIGLAPASLDFALFCQQLEFGERSAPLRLRSIEPELNALQADVVKAFQDPKSDTTQSTFIRINATLKMARELNAEGSYAGALKKYLDALLAFGMTSSGPGQEKMEKLKKETETFRANVASSSIDHTIGQLYVGLVSLTPTDAAVKRAAVIMETVLPAYRRIAMETRP